MSMDVDPRIIGIAAVLLACVAGCLHSAPAGAATRCPDPQAQVLARSHSALITGYVAGRDGNVPTYYDVVGCVRKSARAFDLTRYDRDEHAQAPIRLRTRWAALRVEGIYGDSLYRALKLVRLPLPGEQVRIGYFAGPDCGECDDFTDTELYSDGSIAWISRNGSSYEVRACARRRCLDKGERPVLLDRGRRIAPRSLRLNGRDITWKNGGHSQLATFDARDPARRARPPTAAASTLDP
jgi:hypothetical protein